MQTKLPLAELIQSRLRQLGLTPHELGFRLGYSNPAKAAGHMCTPAIRNLAPGLVNQFNLGVRNGIRAAITRIGKHNEKRKDRTVIEVIFAKLDPKFKKEWVTAMCEDVVADPENRHCYNVNELECLKRWGRNELGEKHIGYSYRVERNSMGELGEPYKHYLTTENLCEWYGGDVGRYYTRLTGEQALPGGIDDWIEANC